VLLHLNDTYGMSAKGAVDKLFPQIGMPFKIVEAIPYDPTTKDLSVEVSKAKATGADVLMNISRINDGIMMIRECVRQRWEPWAIMCPGGPGMYDQQFFDVLGKYSEYAITNTPWINPKAELYPVVQAAFSKVYPKDHLQGHAVNVGCTVEAIMIAADAYQRAGSTNGAELAKALRSTNIPKHVMVGGPIQFDAKGQNNNIGTALIQNRNLRPTVVLPQAAQELAPVFPVPGWSART
jgi:branched-chain amino acid transport system substrate-binding protein